jgi:hypothetical protein
MGRRAQAYTGTNQQYFWLYANESNLNSATVDGYRIAMGDDSGGDNLRLEYIVNGAVSSTVITSSGSTTNGITDIGFLVRVTRSSSGGWEIFTSTLPSSNGTGAIASDVPNSTNAPTSQGTGTNNTLVPATNGYVGVAALHTTGANAIAAAEFDQIYFTAGFTAPTTQATNVTFGNVGNNQFDVSWTSGNGSGRVVSINTSNSFSLVTNGTDPSANSVYGGSGEQIVYNGTGSSVPTVTGLSAGQTYYVRVYEYNGSGASIVFNTNTGTGNPNNQATTGGAAPTQLVVTAINGGGSPSVGTAFSVTVQSQDGSNVAQSVNTNTGVTLTLNSGTGSLGGTLTGTITNGTSQVVISGVTYNTAESGVTILASTNSGMSLTAGTSSSFTVLEAATHFTFVGVPGSAQTNTNLTAFTVEARRTDNSVDLNYNGTVTISKASGPGAISGTLSRSVTAGVSASFNDIQFNTAGSVTIGATDGTISGTSGSITLTAATAATDYFRSNTATGNWNVAGNWESSSDNSNWITSTLVPSSSAATIYIRNGHTISTAASITIDEVVIENGGTLNYNATTLTIANGTGDDITIQNGGIMIWSVSTVPTYVSGATILVNGGGILRVSATGLTSAGAGVNATNVVYDNASILEYTLSSNFSASGVTYFPNVNSSTVPIFRLSNTLANVGGGSATVFNGTFEISGSNTISWQGNSTKTFRNGITTSGTGAMTLGSGTGVWAITGTSADMGGVGGTLTLTNANGITVAGTANITGVVTLGSTNMTQTGGAATLAGTGTIALTGALGTQIGTYNTNTFQTTGRYLFYGNSQVIPAGTYEDMRVQGTGTTLSGDLTVNGDLEMQGTLSVGANTLTISNPILVNPTNLTMDATSSLVINGTAANIHVPSSVTALNNFTYNNSSLVTADANLTISGTFTLGTSGFILDMGANTLEIGTSTASIGAISRVGSGSVRGIIKRWTNTATSSLLFPLNNNATDYVGATVNFSVNPSTGGSLTARYTSTGSGLFPLGPNGIDRYIDFSAQHPGMNLINLSPQFWTISDADGLAGFTYGLSLEANNMGINTSGNNYQYTAIVKRNTGGGNTWAWSNSNHVTTGGSGSNPIPQCQGYTSFSDFAIGGNQDNLLPVELSNFTSAIAGRDLILSWSTGTETNNSGFDIERKSTTGSWSKIGNVAGHGTVNTPNSYTYTDRNLSSGKYNYRLKQIDFNGNYKYYELSNEVIIGTPSKYVLTQNFPNPFNPSTSISYEIPATNFVSLKIYDMMGKEVANLVNGTQEAGFYTVKFDASKLASGVYFYKLQANDFTATKKLMLMK